VSKGRERSENASYFPRRVLPVPIPDPRKPGSPPARLIRCSDLMSCNFHADIGDWSGIGDLPILFNVRSHSWGAIM